MQAVIARTNTDLSFASTRTGLNFRLSGQRDSRRRLGPGANPRAEVQSTAGPSHQSRSPLNHRIHRNAAHDAALKRPIALFFKAEAGTKVTLTGLFAAFA